MCPCFGVKHKDKDTIIQKCNAIYHLTCQNCKANYITETGRSFKQRLKEHQLQSNAATAEHIRLTGHHFVQEESKILGTEEH